VVRSAQPDLAQIRHRRRAQMTLETLLQRANTDVTAAAIEESVNGKCASASMTSTAVRTADGAYG